MLWFHRITEDTHKIKPVSYVNVDIDVNSNLQVSSVLQVRQRCEIETHVCLQESFDFDAFWSVSGISKLNVLFVKLCECV